jgi:ferritin
MNADLLKGLNEHLKLEFRAAHDYLAMAVWLAEHDLPGFASYMRRQSGDEHIHANKIIDHLVERDQKVVVPAIAQPPADWPTAEALVAHVLRSEQEVTASVNNLYDLAVRTGDHPAQVLMQWFVNEQMEEEASARALLGRLKLAGSAGLGLLLIDQELAAGRLPGIPTATGQPPTS